MISGLTIEQNEENVAICTIRDFSDELKDIIRSELSGIAFGLGSKYNDYINTLKDFKKRYLNKKEWDKGGIGELLTHILLRRIFNKFHAISCLFNLEENAFKKGFDIVYHQPDDKQLWYTEIKSGETETKENSTKATIRHLEKAKKDICDKFKSGNSTIWNNAINHARIACRSDNLEEILDKLAQDRAKAQNKNRNVILVSVLFNNLEDTIKYEEILHKYYSIQDIDNLIILCIHKRTYKKICDFISEEIRTSCQS